MPQDQQQPAPEGYPYGEQAQSAQRNKQESQQENPYSASQYPYGGGEQENPYAASQYPYGGGEQENPYSASQYPYGEGGDQENPYAASQYPYGGVESKKVLKPPPSTPIVGENKKVLTPAAGVNSQENYGYGEITQESVPLPLGEAIRQLPQQYLRVVTRPSSASIAIEKGKASWDIVWVQLLGYAIIEAILGYLYNLINPAKMPSNLGRSVTPEMYQALIAALSIGRIFLVPLFFFIGVGILHLIAKAFKGQGNFLQYSYSILLFTLPLNILANLFQLIPVAGPLLFLVVISLAGIYEIVLSIFATMAVHRLSGGKASAVILIPLGVVMLLACAASVLLVTVAMGATGGIR